jgi:hypothetical protein
VFERRHYEAVAKMLFEVKPTLDTDERSTFEDQTILWTRICSKFRQFFQDDNSRFNASRFWNACNGLQTKRGRHD